MNPLPVTQIGIAVVEAAGKYLIGIRKQDQVLAGCAEFPGGKCLPGESPRDCVLRECQEETGLNVTAERLLSQVRFSYPHGDVELHFWLCRPAEASCLTTEHQGFRWTPAAELQTLPFPEANRAILELLTSPEFSRL